MRRWLLFLLSIMIGLAAGLFYGKVIQPVHYRDTSLSSLAEQYKTDFILMTAETYSLEDNPVAAVRRLESLGKLPELDKIRQAILFAEQAGYSSQDLERLRVLQRAVENIVAPDQAPGP
jgi:hypothetical protein